MNKTKRKGRGVSFSLTSPTPSLIPSSPCPVLLRPPSTPENPNPVEPSTGDLSRVKQRGGREQRRRRAAMVGGARIKPRKNSKPTPTPG